jgi:hypothetical protein
MPCFWKDLHPPILEAPLWCSHAQGCVLHVTAANLEKKNTCNVRMKTLMDQWEHLLSYLGNISWAGKHFNRMLLQEQSCDVPVFVHGTVSPFLTHTRTEVKTGTGNGENRVLCFPLAPNSHMLWVSTHFYHTIIYNLSELKIQSLLYRHSVSFRYITHTYPPVVPLP